MAASRDGQVGTVARDAPRLSERESSSSAAMAHAARGSTGSGSAMRWRASSRSSPAKARQLPQVAPAKVRWSPEKELLLQDDTTRDGVSFADCVVAMEDGRVLDVLPHPHLSHQQLAILNIEGYAYVVPFVIEEDGTWFLKTVFPSRKHTALYLSKKMP